MTTASNADRVRSIYAAFGKGDVPAIVELLAEDVLWEYGRPPSEVPWLKDRRGRAQVVEFFQSLAALEFGQFAVSHVLEVPGLVVALVDIEATVKATGKTIREQSEVHLWHFDPRGQVVRFRHVVDTAQHERAWRG